ncbi:WD40 repeat-like protein [Leucogyrophana mollusca]|uniref:WD40 repeat-like protein n=1 Tax=Leucogyrophana mollusca TaxID=85980 RepID=A0ACB8B217_9AGAM|nr:WD40 repeat-like protein [Leucogyrophana mollusca]
MPLHYRSRRRMYGEHTDTITCLTFSPRGTLLAAGGLDGKVTVWSSKTSRLLFVVECKAGVVSVAAVPPSEVSFLVGLTNGAVVSVKVVQEELCATVYEAHTYPVECLAVCGELVATGAHDEVHIWRFTDHEDRWTPVSRVDDPPMIGASVSAEVLVCSLHWPTTAHVPNILMVSYIHHGIVFWDVDQAKAARLITIKTDIGSTSIAADRQLLAVSNISTRFDLYNLASGTPLASLSHKVAMHLRVPVQFIHNRRVLLGGSTVGKICMWDIQTGELLQTLHHPGTYALQHIQTHTTILQTQTWTVTLTKYIIATASSSKEDGPYIELWEGQETYSVLSRLRTASTEGEQVRT